MATPNLQLVQPANNTDIGIWDGPVNANMGAIDTALGGLVTLNAAGASGTVALTLAQYGAANLVITGTPASPVTYQTPAGVGRFFFVANASPAGAPAVSFGSASGGGVATIPPGNAATVVIDPINGGRLANTIAAAAGGLPGQVQFNAAGGLAGDAGLTYVAATDTLTVGGALALGGNLAIGGFVTSKLVVQGGSAATQTQTLSFAAASMPIDCSLSNVFSVILSASVSAAPVFSNQIDGQTVNVRLAQDGTGSRTMMWPSNFRWVGGSAGVLSTPAGSVDLLVASYFATSGTWLCSLLKGFA
jgi:hypothetical protein